MIEGSHNLFKSLVVSHGLPHITTFMLSLLHYLYFHLSGKNKLGFELELVITKK